MKEQISENYKLQEVVFGGKYEDNNILPSPQRNSFENEPGWKFTCNKPGKYM